jgi:hypothetical protein
LYEILANWGHGREGPDMLERRGCPRAKVSCAVLYHTNVDPIPKVALAFDLSVGGLGIETSDYLGFGDVLHITIAIHSKLIKCKGKVVHLLERIGEGLKVGIRFEVLFKQDRLFLGALISYFVGELDQGSLAKVMMIGMGFGLLLWVAIIYAILAIV